MHIPKDPFRRHVLFTLQLTRQELERLQDRPVTATPAPFSFPEPGQKLPAPG